MEIMTSGQGHKSAEDMDQERERSVAYQYLCHLTEARIWLHGVLGTGAADLPEGAVLMEETLRTGVHLALLGHLLAPDHLPLNKIYDVNHQRYKVHLLSFYLKRSLYFRFNQLNYVKFV